VIIMSQEAQIDAASGVLKLWSTADPAERARMAKDWLSASIVYADPHVPQPISSREGFLKFIEIFRANLSDAEVQLTAAPQIHHTYARLRFAVLRGGKPFSSGSFFLTFDASGRIERMIGFVD
jgi:hypothetical protein